MPKGTEVMGRGVSVGEKRGGVGSHTDIDIIEKFHNIFLTQKSVRDGRGKTAAVPFFKKLLAEIKGDDFLLPTLKTWLLKPMNSQGNLGHVGHKDLAVKLNGGFGLLIRQVDETNHKSAAVLAAFKGGNLNSVALNRQSGNVGRNGSLRIGVGQIEELVELAVLYAGAASLELSGVAGGVAHAYRSAETLNELKNSRRENVSLKGAERKLAFNQSYALISALSRSR